MINEIIQWTIIVFLIRHYYINLEFRNKTIDLIDNIWDYIKNN